MLRLALEYPVSDVTVILDDMRAREAAERHGLRFTGTLGVQLETKRAGLLPEVRPHFDRLDFLGFRLARHTQAAVLKLAGEES